MGNAESGVAFSEDFIGQVNSMAAMMSEEGSIPLTSLKPLVEVLKDIGQSIRHVEEMCSRLEKEVASLRDQQRLTDSRVLEQGAVLRNALRKHSSTRTAAENAANTEKSEEETRQKEKTSETTAGEENTEAEIQIEKKRRDRQRAQSAVYATTESENSNIQKTQFEYEDAEIRDVKKFVLPKSISGQNLFNAAAAGQITELKYLLDAGVDPNETAPGGTALHKAAAKGHLSCISLLLKRGACPDITDILGRSPLHLASLHGQIESIKELIKYGASLTAGEGNGQRPLHYAAIGGFGEAVKEILKRGEKVDVMDNCGETPLSLAVTYNRPGSTKALLPDQWNLQRQTCHRMRILLPLLCLALASAALSLPLNEDAFEDAYDENFADEDALEESALKAGDEKYTDLADFDENSLNHDQLLEDFAKAGEEEIAYAEYQEVASPDLLENDAVEESGSPRVARQSGSLKRRPAVRYPGGRPTRPPNKPPRRPPSPTRPKPPRRHTI